MINHFWTIISNKTRNIFHKITMIERQRFLKKYNSSIVLNIWDDYFDDGFVPEGKTQATYIYVESADRLFDAQREVLMWRLKAIINEHFPALKISDPTNDELHIENLTHIVRIALKKKLSQLKIVYEDVPLLFISES
jgi:hypothetical protein